VKTHRLLLLLAGAAALLSYSASAHHSGVIYDRQNPITLEGTVTDYQFVNPHVLIHFEVKDANGGVVKWVAISAPPQTLYRNDGWTKTTLKPGDKITVIGAPSKAEGHVISVVKLTGANIPVLTRGGG
jgi:hypothetical protein